MERERDSQLDRLAAKLRDEGIPPERDLWPEIDAAITRREQAGRRRRGPTWWQAAAAAAAVAVLALGLGTLLPRGGPAPDAGAPVGTPAEVAAAPAEAGDSLDTVDRALDQLEEALEADPDNLSLSRLVLMIHQTRSELLRKNLTAGLRAG